MLQQNVVNWHAIPIISVHYLNSCTCVTKLATKSFMHINICYVTNISYDKWILMKIKNALKENVSVGSICMTLHCNTFAIQNLLCLWIYVK